MLRKSREIESAHTFVCSDTSISKFALQVNYERVLFFPDSWQKEYL
jgi:hypothetical protein